MHLGFFAGAVILMISSTAIATLRYQTVLRTISPDSSVSFFPLMKLNLLTTFSAHFLPFGALADAIRAIVSRNLLNVSVSTAVEGVIADRILAIVGFAFLGLLLLPIQIAIHSTWPLVASQALVFSGLLMVVTIIALGFGRYAKLIKLPTSARGPLARPIMTWRGLCWQLCLATANTALFAAMLTLLARSLNLPLSPWLALTVTPAIYLSQVIPIFYAGFGSREVALTALLVPSGVLVSSDAVTLGLSIGLCNLVASLPGAVSARVIVQISRTKSIELAPNGSPPSSQDRETRAQL